MINFNEKQMKQINEIFADHDRYKAALQKIVDDANSDKEYLISGDYLQGYHRLIAIARQALNPTNNQQ